MGGCEGVSHGLSLGFHLLLLHRKSWPRSLSLHRMAPTNANQIMESFDMFLNGNFVAVQYFQRHFGVYVGPGPNDYAIETKWQSSLFQSGQCGAFLGVLIAGPITNRVGYRWTAIIGLILMNATIFVSFFVSDLFRLLQDSTNNTA